jgi:hypothetical protein
MFPCTWDSASKCEEGDRGAPPVQVFCCHRTLFLESQDGPLLANEPPRISAPLQGTQVLHKQGVYSILANILPNILEPRDGDPGVARYILLSVISAHASSIERAVHSWTPTLANALPAISELLPGDFALIRLMLSVSLV